jgi:energy-coupling factor transporter ATP-binding protein EcfA2
MRLGDLLVRAKLVTEGDIAKALERQVVQGGRLGENLVEIGAIDQGALDTFIHRIPLEPGNIAATGIEEADLLGLLMKLIYTGRLETNRQFVDAIKLPYVIVMDLVQMAIGRKLLHTLGTRDAESMVDMRYQLTEEGRRWTIDALERLRYVGPAPVTLEQFTEQVSLQKLTNEVISFDQIRASFAGLTFDDSIVEQCGPALNSGRAMLLYGPPGNGKSSVAHCLGNVFSDVIYVPYAISVDGQVIRVHDSSVHVSQGGEKSADQDSSSFLRHEEYDARWVPCRRPFILTGGELTLEMLDLRYDESGRFYEAPLHLKALGGCFVIDDFGRQLVSPTNLLNRWIVPLESRVDYLKLHTGKTFSVPFEELIIFSTNLDPEDLMDTAFLRRLPYKIEVGAPDRENYRRIFNTECARRGLTMPDEVFDTIVRMITEEKGLELAAYHPRFIVDQVLATCRFMGKAPHFEPRFIEYAINNLRVKHGSSAKTPTSTAARIT